MVNFFCFDYWTQIDSENVAGVVTRVIEQAPCNSCHAQVMKSSHHTALLHSQTLQGATAAIESCFALASGSSAVPLSAQELIDCTVGLKAGEGTELDRGNLGCTAGFPDVHLKESLH